jgi:hypothetical protein
MPEPLGGKLSAARAAAAVNVAILMHWESLGALGEMTRGRGLERTNHCALKLAMILEGVFYF